MQFTNLIHQVQHNLLLSLILLIASDNKSAMKNPAGYVQMELHTLEHVDVNLTEHFLLHSRLKTAQHN